MNVKSAVFEFESVRSAVCIPGGGGGPVVESGTVGCDCGSAAASVSSYAAIVLGGGGLDGSNRDR